MVKVPDKPNLGRVIDIRGTHGSGKSYLVKTLLVKYNWGEEVIEDGVHIGYEIPELKCGVVARYTDTGGGCDAVKTADEVVRRVRMFSKRYKCTVFEGILVSHTFQRYADLADELGKDRYLLLFLDTPLEECIGRVRNRRLEKGNTNPFDPKNVVKDYNNIMNKVQNKFRAGRYITKTLDHKRPLECLIENIRGVK